MKISYDDEAWELYLRAIKQLADDGLAVRVGNQEITISDTVTNQNGYVSAVIGREFQNTTGEYDGAEVTIHLIDNDGMVRDLEWNVL